MYQSIPSLTNPAGEFFRKSEFPTPGHKEISKLRPLGQRNRAKAPPRGNYLKKNSAKTKYGTEMIKNSTGNANMF